MKIRIRNPKKMEQVYDKLAAVKIRVLNNVI